jgi:hypothetical protein
MTTKSLRLADWQLEATGLSGSDVPWLGSPPIVCDMAIALAAVGGEGSTCAAWKAHPTVITDDEGEDADRDRRR